MEKILNDIEALGGEAAAFIEGLSPQEGGATLVTLSGELGAGKTAFVKAAAKALGVEDTVNSPTFVLEKIYALPKSVFKKLIHIDAYRLEGGADLSALGFDEIMKDPLNLLMLEWPERVSPALPTPTKHISLTALPDGSRKLVYG